MTAQEFKDKYFNGDINDYYWRTSGRFTYGVLLKEEVKVESIKKIEYFNSSKDRKCDSLNCKKLIKTHDKFALVNGSKFFHVGCIKDKKKL